MDIKNMAVEKLKFAPYNARKMKASVFEKLKESIKRFKVYLPLIVNLKNYHTIGGNQRLRALRELGYREVMVITVDLPLAEEMALNLLLNRLVGEFYDPALPQVYQTILKQPELIPLTGFDLPDMLRTIDLYMAPPQEAGVEEEVKSQKAKTVTKLGDLVQLGVHKIFCGDFTCKENLLRLFGSEKIALEHSDLPYGTNLINGKYASAKSSQGKNWLSIANDDLAGPKYMEWFRTGRMAVMPFLADGAPCYLWSGFVNFGPMTQALSDMKYHVSNIISWIKPSACMGFGQYKFASEFLVFGWWKKGKVRCWNGPKTETNVWKIDREDTVFYEHPTAKPVSLACRVLRNSSKRGDIVFDACSGGGFNMIACEQMCRVFRGCELEPYYVDVMVRRYARTFGIDKLSAEVRRKYFEGRSHGKV